MDAAGPATRRDDHGLGAAYLAVDLVILTVRDGALHVLLIERGKEPFRGRQALPGGFVKHDEDVPSAAQRELREETGLEVDRLHLEQLTVFSAPGRDSRGKVISVPYLAMMPDLPAPTAGSDAAGACWVEVDRALSGDTKLAFDHHDILDLAVERAAEMLEYTTLATVFCADEFTIGDVRRVYEAVWRGTVNDDNFHRKITSTEGFVESTARKRRSKKGAPASLYRRGEATVLFPPMLRSRLVVPRSDEVQ